MKLTIRKRSLFTMIPLAAVIVALVILSSWAITHVAGHVNDLARAAEIRSMVGNLRSGTLNLRRFEKDFIINQGDEAAQRKYMDQWREMRGEFEKKLSAFDERRTTDAEHAEVREMRQAVERYAAGVEAMFAADREDPTRTSAQLNAIVDPVKDEIHNVFNGLDRIARESAKEIGRATAAADKAQAQSSRWILFLGVVATALLLVVLGMLSRGITNGVGAVIAATSRLNDAVSEGRLSERGDLESVGPEFVPVLQGFNQVMDAYAEPITLTSKTLESIAAGDIPDPINRDLGGDFNRIRDSLNRCIQAVHAVLGDMRTLSGAAVDGQLKVRVDASKHAGDFRKIVEGMNATLDGVVGPLNLAAKYVDSIAKGDIPSKITDSYRGEFNAIKENLNRCVDAIGQLVSDTSMLAASATDGQLAKRVDASRHHGDYRKIIDGLNRTLDALQAPINEASQVLERLAQRDLRARMQGEYKGDHAKIKTSLNQTASALHDALAQVSSSVDQVSSAAGQIASSSQAVADGASSQASSLEETSSSLESMSSMTRRSADSAQQANALAQTAKTAASGGASAVEQMTVSMGKIKASAEGTSQIIKDINEIAFQTNLLALNAAVEAARAGEAGRGFAVVAEEVRSLALRSKEAATKTEELIRESVRQAGEGEVTAKQVSSKLADILAGVTKVSEIVTEISASAKEQAAGVDQVTQAVADMNKVTQQNAANSEESSSAAAELSSQAEELAAMVGSFQLAKTSGVGLSASVRPASAHAAPRPAPVTMKRPSAASQARPDQVIPLEQDPAFRDF
jgi:methyl-accepting chemotaxis protein